MKRRQFLKTGTTAVTSAVTLPIFVNGMSVSTLANSALFSAINGESDRVLVLIQLNGGNDGLNTLIPLDQYDKLANLRSNIIIPESSLLNIEDNLALHPNMAGMQNMYAEGELGIVQSVGYANQNRSHFRSTDIWMSGSASEEVINTGWLGRDFDSKYPGFPEGYPDENCPDPFAITMGSQASQTCQGIGGNFSVAIRDPFNLNPLAAGGDDVVPMTPYGDELTYLRTIIDQTNAYSDTITAAADNGNSLVEYPDDNALAQALKNVATLISGGLQTKIYVVSLGGFDTHANQAEEGSPETGEHAVLMNMLSEAVSLFQQDLKLLEIEERVVGMTFSEFGRRIRSNDSLGTDHGDAAPLMLFGNCVTPGVLGNNPEIGTDVGTGEGIPYQFDFRDIYGSVLMDWFEVSEENVKNVLFPEFTYLPIVNTCLDTSSNEVKFLKPQIDIKNYPNPFANKTTIEFENPTNEHVYLSVINSAGQTVAILIDKTLSKGIHKINFDGKNLAHGNYYYQIKLKNGAQKTKLFTKLR